MVAVEGRATMSKKILIADDNLFIRTLVKAALAPLGHEIVEATDGQEAIEEARLHRPDLILLDVVMPRMDGFQALSSIRSEMPAEDCSIVMLTTSATEADKHRSADAGADDYIVKPFEKSLLRDVVQGLLGDS